MGLFRTTLSKACSQAVGLITAPILIFTLKQPSATRADVTNGHPHADSAPPREVYAAAPSSNGAAAPGAGRPPARRHDRRAAVETGVVLALVLGAVAGAVMWNVWRPTYYIVYVGRNETPAFDQLHVSALKKFIRELNNETSGARFELMVRYIKYDDDAGKAQYDSVPVYDEIIKEKRVVAVLDNTWGSDLPSVADKIIGSGLPVISLNADWQRVDYGKNVVFIGYDDTVAERVPAFARRVLGIDKAIFIAESDYPLTQEMRGHLDALRIETAPIEVLKSMSADPASRESLLRGLDAALARWDYSRGKPTVILNTHGRWGEEVIKHIDTNHREVTILGGPFILGSGGEHRFGLNDRDNRLIVLTHPRDAVPNKVYKDERMISAGNPKFQGPAPADLRGPLFVKRCLDAVFIIRGAVLDGGDKGQPPSRALFTSFFRGSLAGQTYQARGRDELYPFNGDLLLADERTFQQQFHGVASTYPQQLSSQMQAIPNVVFGLDIINISNVNIDERTFHADFLYWLKYDGEPPVKDYVHFQNQKGALMKDEIPVTDVPDVRVRKLYKVSGDFIMDVDLRKYPFDAQELRIEAFLINPADKRGISFDYESFNRSRKVKNFQLGEWQQQQQAYASVDAGVGPSLWGSTPGGLQTFKSVNVRIPIKRRGPPIVALILPLAVIGFAAVALLYVGDNSFANLGQAAVGFFLSIVGYSITMAQVGPKTGQVTVADLLFYCTVATVLVIYLKVVFYKPGDPALAGRATPASRRRRLIKPVGAYLLLMLGTLVYGFYFR